MDDADLLPAPPKHVVARLKHAEADRRAREAQLAATLKDRPKPGLDEEPPSKPMPLGLPVEPHSREAFTIDVELYRKSRPVLLSLTRSAADSQAMVEEFRQTLLAASLRAANAARAAGAPRRKAASASAERVPVSAYFRAGLSLADALSEWPEARWWWGDADASDSSGTVQESQRPAESQAGSLDSHSERRSSISSSQQGPSRTQPRPKPASTLKRPGTERKTRDLIEATGRLTRVRLVAEGGALVEIKMIGPPVPPALAPRAPEALVFEPKRGSVAVSSEVRRAEAEARRKADLAGRHPPPLPPADGRELVTSTLLGRCPPDPEVTAAAEAARDRGARTEWAAPQGMLGSFHRFSPATIGSLRALPLQARVAVVTAVQGVLEARISAEVDRARGALARRRAFSKSLRSASHGSRASAAALHTAMRSKDADEAVRSATELRAAATRGHRKHASGAPGAGGGESRMRLPKGTSLPEQEAARASGVVRSAVVRGTTSAVVNSLFARAASLAVAQCSEEQDAERIAVQIMAEDAEASVGAGIVALAANQSQAAGAAARGRTGSEPGWMQDDRSTASSLADSVDRGVRGSHSLADLPHPKLSSPLGRRPGSATTTPVLPDARASRLKNARRAAKLQKMRGGSVVAQGNRGARLRAQRAIDRFVREFQVTDAAAVTVLEASDLLQSANGSGKGQDAPDEGNTDSGEPAEGTELANELTTVELAAINEELLALGPAAAETAALEIGLGLPRKLLPSSAIERLKETLKLYTDDVPAERDPELAKHLEWARAQPERVGFAGGSPVRTMMKASGYQRSVQDHLAALEKQEAVKAQEPNETAPPPPAAAAVAAVGAGERLTRDLSSIRIEAAETTPLSMALPTGINIALRRREAAQQEAADAAARRSGSRRRDAVEDTPGSGGRYTSQPVAMGGGADSAMSTPDLLRAMDSSLRSRTGHLRLQMKEGALLRGSQSLSTREQLQERLQGVCSVLDLPLRIKTTVQSQPAHTPSLAGSHALLGGTGAGSPRGDETEERRRWKRNLGVWESLADNIRVLAAVYAGVGSVKRRAKQLRDRNRSRLLLSGAAGRRAMGLPEQVSQPGDVERAETEMKRQRVRPKPTVATARQPRPKSRNLTVRKRDNRGAAPPAGADLADSLLVPNSSASRAAAQARAVPGFGAMSTVGLPAVRSPSAAGVRPRPESAASVSVATESAQSRMPRLHPENGQRPRDGVDGMPSMQDLAAMDPHGGEENHPTGGDSPGDALASDQGGVSLPVPGAPAERPNTVGGIRILPLTDPAPGLRDSPPLQAPSPHLEKRDTNAGMPSIALRGRDEAAIGTAATARARPRSRAHIAKSFGESTTAAKEATTPARAPRRGSVFLLEDDQDASPADESPPGSPLHRPPARHGAGGADGSAAAVLPTLDLAGKASFEAIPQDTLELLSQTSWISDTSPPEFVARGLRQAHQQTKQQGLQRRRPQAQRAAGPDAESEALNWVKLERWLLEVHKLAYQDVVQSTVAARRLVGADLADGVKFEDVALPQWLMLTKP
jgi:hypothetical protein